MHRQIKTFDPDHWPMRLNVPPGLQYVDTDDVNEMIRALDEGLGVFTSSCGGHIFLWSDVPGRFHADHFFHGPPTTTHYRSSTDAAHYAVGCAI